MDCADEWCEVAGESSLAYLLAFELAVDVIGSAGAVMVELFAAYYE